MSAPCCAVFACAAVATAVAGSAGLMNSNMCMAMAPACRLRCSANLLNSSDDIGIRAAPTDVATHQFLYGCVVGAAGLLEQRDRGHDLACSAIPTLISVMFYECRLHRMQCVGS